MPGLVERGNFLSERAQEVLFLFFDAGQTDLRPAPLHVLFVVGVVRIQFGQVEQGGRTISLVHDLIVPGFLVLPL